MPVSIDPTRGADPVSRGVLEPTWCEGSGVDGRLPVGQGLELRAREVLAQCGTELFFALERDAMSGVGELDEVSVGEPSAESVAAARRNQHVPASFDDESRQS